MITRLKELLDMHRNFAFETTASGKNYIKHLKKAQDQGYEITMIYLWLADEDLAIKRVAHRVAQGGHHIPDEIVRRRYWQGLENVIKHYLPLVNNALLLDNSDIELQKIIVRKSVNNGLKIEDLGIWEKMQRLING